MSETMAPVPKDDPLMRAWEAHKQTEDYANSKKWAAHEQHVDGSLWALFSAGWAAGKDHERGLTGARLLTDYNQAPD